MSRLYQGQMRRNVFSLDGKCVYDLRVMRMVRIPIKGILIFVAWETADDLSDQHLMIQTSVPNYFALSCTSHFRIG